MNFDQDFKTLLKRELEQRTGRNPRYSLRAFAKDMQVAPALMSDILNGKRGLSRNSAKHFARKLGLSDSETEVFCDLVESKHARSKTVREQAKSRLIQKAGTGVVLKFLTLDQEKFNLLSDWYHLAIFELMKTSTFQNDPKWIAKRLDLSVHQVTVALSRMVKLGMIVLKNHHYLPASESISTPDGISSQAMKLHHEQFSKKAMEALFTHDLEERDFRGLTIKCKKSDVKLVRERLKKFLLELDAELSQGEGDEVYQLSTQFYCLTKTTATSTPKPNQENQENQK